METGWSEPWGRVSSHSAWCSTHLCDSGALERLLAVLPAVLAARGGVPVSGGRSSSRGHGDAAAMIEGHVAGQLRSAVWLAQKAEVQSGRGGPWGPSGAAQMRGNGPGEHGHQHVERQEYLRHTDPHIQELLELPKASDFTQNVIEVHCAGRLEMHTWNVSNQSALTEIIPRW